MQVARASKTPTTKLRSIGLMVSVVTMNLVMVKRP